MRNRRMLRNEDYPKQANLTPEQAVYNALWKNMRPMQRGEQKPMKIAVGFKPRPHQREVHPLSPKRPIRDLDSVMAVIMVAIPSEHWRGSPHDRRYRFHTMELQAQFANSEVVFQRPGLQFDFGKSPLQDHQVFRMTHFDPASLGAQIEQARQEAENTEVEEARIDETDFQPGKKDSPSRQDSEKDLCSLTSPLAGDLVTTRDDLFINIWVGKTIIYRFNLDASVEPIADGYVQKGSLVARLIGKQDYQTAELMKNGKPHMDQIGPDVLSASRFRPLFRMSNLLLSGIVSGTNPHTGAEIPIEQSSKLLPKLLAVFSLESSGKHGDWVDTLRATDEFEPSGELKKQVLVAVQPGGQLKVEAPVSGTLTGVDDFGPYKQLNFLSEDGVSVHTMVLPKCAVLHEPYRGRETPVECGEVLGDWVKRDFYPDYTDLGIWAETGLIAIESAYLRSQAIKTGEKGFEEDGVAIDARLVDSAIHLAEGFKLDFSVMLADRDNFFNGKDGSVGPVLIQTDHTQVHAAGFCINGIRYLPPLRGYCEEPEQKRQEQSRRRHGSRA